MPKPLCAPEDGGQQETFLPKKKQWFPDTSSFPKLRLKKDGSLQNSETDYHSPKWLFYFFITKIGARSPSARRLRRLHTA